MFLYKVVQTLSRRVLCTCRQSRIVCHERNAEEGVQRQERVILGNGAEKDERKAFISGL